jgi:osmotically inducible protein OsmC
MTPEGLDAAMATAVLYTTSVFATGGRDGRVRSADGSLDLVLAMPKELGGTAKGNNPEQLFAAAYAASFLGAMKFVASEGGPRVPVDASVIGTIGVGPRSQGGFEVDIRLDVVLPGLARDDAEALVQRAHLVCPFSNFARDNVSVSVLVT